MDMHHLYSVGRMAMEPGWHLPFHSHDHCHELVLVVDGAIETAMEGGTGLVSAGMAKLHPRDIPHQERAIGKQGLRILIVSWRERPGCDVLALPRIAEDRHGRLRYIMEWMSDLWARQDAESLRTAQHVFEAVMATYAGLGDNEPLPATGPIVNVQTWAKTQLARQINLDHLARHSGMSRFHFARAFRTATGQAPMAWLRAQRVEAARTLLLSTALPLKAIARRVGFPDEFHLSRVFKRVTGQNPTQVRRLR
jgi:AraC-like DNA-binding protein